MFEFFFAVAIAEETVVADALEAIGSHVQQKAPNEFIGGEGHHLLLTAVAVFLVSGIAPDHLRCSRNWIFTDILFMNSEYERLGQEVGCGTRTAQIIYDLGPGQFAAT